MPLRWFPSKHAARAPVTAKVVPADVLDSMVALLAAALELRDDETGQHTHRVTQLGLALARAIAPELAADPQLRYGFLPHDIGKIGVPDAILLKPDALEPSKVRLMEQHTVLDAQLVKSSPFLDGVAQEWHELSDDTSLLDDAA